MADGIPCRWENGEGICMLDGLFCDGECESYEPRLPSQSEPFQREVGQVAI